MVAPGTTDGTATWSTVHTATVLLSSHRPSIVVGDMITASYPVCALPGNQPSEQVEVPPRCLSYQQTAVDAASPRLAVMGIGTKGTLLGGSPLRLASLCDPRPSSAGQVRNMYVLRCVPIAASRFPHEKDRSPEQLVGQSRPLFARPYQPQRPGRLQVHSYSYST